MHYNSVSKFLDNGACFAATYLVLIVIFGFAFRWWLYRGVRNLTK